MNLMEHLAAHGTAVSKNQGEHLFRQGDQNRSVYFVQSGLSKAYYTSADGKEHVKSFLMVGGFIGSLTACCDHTKSSFSIVCMEPSTFIEMPFDELRQLAATNIDAAQFVINGLLQLAMKKERREFEFLCLSAQQRYQLLLEREADLVEKITQIDLARYLGITPVGLSRIKTRLQNNSTA